MKQTALEAEESRLQTSLEETRTILLGLQASNTSTEQKLEVAQTDLAKVRPEQNTSVFFFRGWLFPYLNFYEMSHDKFSISLFLGRIILSRIDYGFENDDNSAQ